MLAGAGAPVKVATHRGHRPGPALLADGRRIALLVTVGARKEAGATQAGVRQVGEIGEQNDEQRIAVVPASGGTLAPVSPADRYVYEYDWTPDGSGFVATSRARQWRQQLVGRRARPRSTPRPAQCTASPRQRCR